MKKFFSFLLLSLMFVWAYGQDTLYSTDFEFGTAGQYVAQQDTSGFWTTWSDAPGGSEDALFSDAQNHSASGTLSAHTQSTTDLVLKLGNKVSGKYEVSFYYYIINGKGAYFNIQHTEQMGQEFAIQCYFGSDGNGKLEVDGHTLPSSAISFTHAIDNWVHVDLIANLDSDSAYLYIDDNLIYSWIFSHKYDGTEGLNQLGAVDFFAGALDGQTPEFYLDDVTYIQLNAGAQPSQAEINLTGIGVNANTTSSVDLKIKNTGELDLMYDVFPVYPATSKNNSVSQVNTTNNNVVKLTPSDVNSVPAQMKVNLNPKDVNLTHLQSDIASALGWNTSSPVDVEVAALFKSDEVNPYIGMTLTQLIIVNGNQPEAGSTYAKVWQGRRFTVPGPIEEVASQAFTVGGTNSQNAITLDNPITITGEDLFLGWSYTQPVDSFCASMDGGPLVDDANWTHAGPSWSEVTRTDFGNFGIVGVLTGTAAHQWITLQSNQGIIAGGDSATVTVGFDTTGMAEGEYHAELIVRSDDLDTSRNYVHIPVDLWFAPAEVDNMNKVAIMTFPNPAYDYLNIKSSDVIRQVEIVGLNGQVARTLNTNATETRINISGLAKGVYIVKVYTDQATTTSKLVIK